MERRSPRRTRDRLPSSFDTNSDIVTKSYLEILNDNTLTASAYFSAKQERLGGTSRQHYQSEPQLSLRELLDRAKTAKQRNGLY